MNVEAKFTDKTDRNQLTDSDIDVMKFLLRLDYRTFVHCLRTRELAHVIGTALGLSSRELSQLKMGSLLHDIGKYQIPLEILNKDTALSTEEVELIRTHPIHGWQYIASLPSMDDTVKGIVLNHHRWANGKGGYPTHLEGERPCFLTQIVTVADEIDFMTSKQAFRPPLSIGGCIDFLDQNSDTQFNRHIVAAVQMISGEISDLIRACALL
ncbi:MAG TPA: hypothetical protein DDZ66_06800 [Firmicutes bacterium]|nr:hypothetical protein [Bacillota bacterium]